MQRSALDAEVRRSVNEKLEKSGEKERCPVLLTRLKQNISAKSVICGVTCVRAGALTYFSTMSSMQLTMRQSG